MKGVFITFEGPEGSGKTTQARLLASYLKSQGYETVLTREPGGTEIGDAIRKILLNPDFKDMGEVTELLLLSASRAQNVKDRIRPALERGNIVICDRFTDSTLAYQGFGRRFDIELLMSLNRIATGGIFPELTILLDLPVEEGLARSRALQKEESKAGKGDRIEQEGIDFHRRLREGFLELARRDPKRIRVVTAQDKIESAYKIIKEIAEDFLKKTGRGGRD